MTDAAQLLEYVQLTGIAAFLILLRIGTATALIPAFGEQSIPAKLRLVVAACFTLLVLPAVHPSLSLSAGTAESLLALAAGEIAIGLILGLSLRMTVMVLQIAGTIIAQSISLSQVFASAGSEPMTVVGEMLVLGGIALAVTLGLHVELVRCLVGSYQTLPPGYFPSAEESAGWLTSRAAGVMTLAFTLAMPFVSGALIYNFALGIINKAMPQLMVAMVGAPALTLGGLSLLTICAPLILSTWLRHLGEILARPL